MVLAPLILATAVSTVTTGSEVGFFSVPECKEASHCIKVQSPEATLTDKRATICGQTVSKDEFWEQYDRIKVASEVREEAGFCHWWKNRGKADSDDSFMVMCDMGAKFRCETKIYIAIGDGPRMDCRIIRRDGGGLFDVACEEQKQK